MPRRGEILQQVFDLGHEAVACRSSCQTARDLFGPADDTRTVLGALWDENKGALDGLCEQIRCGRCPYCEAAAKAQPIELHTVAGPVTRCLYAAVDAVEAFKAGAMAALATKTVLQQV